MVRFIALGVPYAVSTGAVLNRAVPSPAGLAGTARVGSVRLRVLGLVGSVRSGRPVCVLLPTRGC